MQRSYLFLVAGRFKNKRAKITDLSLSKKQTNNATY